MEKLNFEYDESSGYPARLNAEYRGLTIQAIQDESPEDPWTNSDGLAPLLWTAGDDFTEHGDAQLQRPLAAIKDSAISRKWRQLCETMGANADDLELDVREDQKHYGGRLVDCRRAKLGDALDSMCGYHSRNSWPVDYVEALAELWTLAGCEALSFQRNGYSQGDSVLGLLVATPEWRKAMGIKPSADLTTDLERQADLFGHWAFGDCYGFVIKSPNGETLDSLWGFIGDNFEESGLAEAAKESADSILADAAKRKAETLKTLIRNRVPLAKRPAILAEAGRPQELRYMTAAQWQAKQVKESA